MIIAVGKDIFFSQAFNGYEKIVAPVLLKFVLIYVFYNFSRKHVLGGSHLFIMFIGI